MTSLTEFLFPAPAPRRAGAILAWWERRRLAYNVMVGAAGLVSLTVNLGTRLLFGDVIRADQAIVPIVAFAVMANLCYLLGPAVEILATKLWGRGLLPTGPALFRMGLTFSVGLALFPGMILTILAVVRTLANILGYPA